MKWWSAVPLLLALVGTVVCVVLLARRARRERVAAAGRAAAARAREASRPQPVARPVAVDPNPTGRGVPVLGDGDTVGLRWLRPDIGGPTQTLPPVPAPTPEPIPVVPVDPDAPTLLLPEPWETTPVDPGEATPLVPGPVPEPPAWATSFTGAIERAELLRRMSLAELAALRADEPSQNGAQR